MISGRTTALILLVALLGGCQATLPVERQPLEAPRGNAELTEYISNLEYVTADAGFRAVYILATRETFDGDYAALRTAMEQRGLLPPDVEPRRLLTRADVGGLVARACQVRTGVNWRLTGLGRYAWRELLYLGIARNPAELNYISGGEFLGVLNRAENFVTRRDRESRVELSSAP